MARKRRRKHNDLAVLIPLGVVSYFLIQPEYGLFVYVLLAGSVTLLWALFVMPTQCGYDLGTRGCIRDTYGKLNGCWQHGALKRDAIFAAFRMRNPGQVIRVKWYDGSAPKGRTLGAASPPPPTPQSKAGKANARKGSYEMVMLAIALVGSVAGVLALFVS